MSLFRHFPIATVILISGVAMRSLEALAAPKAGETPHWSLQPLRMSAEGGVWNADWKERRGANPIDRFIDAKLAEKGLQRSPAADPRTLIRRLSFDLTGLPPAPGEVEALTRAFTGADPSTINSQLSTFTDRLLASPRYGERWARHWLDTIHFADSHGYEHDIGRDNAWRYRDYVISAFNNDTPYPRFIQEQLAADHFFPDEPQLTPALGFLGAGLFDMSAYATTVAMFDYIDRDDLVTQTMSTFVSTTANCARCHAHKFDPITQEDYYALQSVFSGILKGDLAYDEDPAVNRERKRWLALQKAAEKPAASVVLAEENAAIVRAWLEQPAREVTWQPLAVETFLSSDGTTLTRNADGSLLAGGTRPDKDTYTVAGVTTLPEITAVRLKVLAHDSLPMRGPGRQDNGNLHLSEVELQVFPPDKEKPQPLKIRRATADFNQTDWGIERAIDGDLKTAWGIHPAVGQSHQAVFELTEKLALPPGSRLAVVLKQLHGTGHLIGAFSLAATSHPIPNSDVLPAEVEAALRVEAANRTEAQRIAIAAHALRVAAAEAIAKLPPQSRVFAAAPSVDILSGDPQRTPKALPEPKAVHILARGDFDKPGALAEPGALSALTHLPARFSLPNPKNEAARRAALADWSAHHDNVLTWRSIVNRVWHYHFGRGLCDTPSDFGKMGGTPSHPELIDWLAVWFRDEAQGSLKALHRLIVTSETYRQSSQSSVPGVQSGSSTGHRAPGTEHYASALTADSENRLLWRQNRHRLDADSFRDFTLAASGKLDLTMGGPAVQHFTQSKGPQNTPALDYTAYDWNGPGAGRRSIYRFVWRGIADPLMEALDFPDLGLLAPTRGFSASSLQALALYNNGFVMHHCDAFARRVEKEASTPAEQVQRAVSLAWQRAPSASELADFTAFVSAHGLPSFCRLLLNSNEFLFVD